ncbi:MAG TPA: hypothetical protein VIM11_09365 [Tepidisphaeraceae bacterium]
MKTIFPNPSAVFLLLALALSAGCHSSGEPTARTPEFSLGEGAISGQLLNADKDPFDVSLGGDDGAKAIKIELLSPSAGVAAVTYPQKDKAKFTFSHVPPGRYEISVFAVVASKRTIAGSTQITVDPGKVTPANVKLAVTPVQN